ncbi:MAG: hypothetical protein ACLT1L_03725 [Leuconostoc lactis]|uniref:hypothetical protein n=1 Tax=Leuconostoc lactis TaxID=1246 RepID=UPI003993A5FE
MRQKKNSNWPVIIGFVLVTLFFVNAALSYGHSIRLVKAQQQVLKDNQAKAKKYEKQTQDIKDVKAADIRDTNDFQKIGETFLTDMFDALPNIAEKTPQSSVATNDVISAFIGATSGGDCDEIDGKPEIKLDNQDIVYSKAPDGTGIGFGTIHFTFENKPIALTLLMHIQDGKIIELQTGQVVDTTGRGK